MSQQQTRDKVIQHAKEMAEEDAAKIEGREPKDVKKLLEDDDALLDEIDALLEDQENLRNFRQRGGQ